MDHFQFTLTIENETLLLEIVKLTIKIKKTDTTA